jgi:hypothetical protein
VAFVTYLTVAAAAERVKRTKRTIERWIAAGLETEMLGGVHYIDEEALLAELRRRILANPKRSRRAESDM